MARRRGWLALAGIAALFLVINAVAGAWFVGLALRDGEVLDAIGAAVPVGFGVVFWKWIAGGAWYRANPPLDPATGEPVRDAEPVGPWGVVGRVLMVVLVGAVVVGGIWFATLDRRATDAADGVRDQAERTVRRQGTTVAQVDEAEVLHANGSWEAEGTADPYDELLTVPGARLVDVSTDEGEAALLLEPDRGPPCVVVTIDRDDLVRSRLTSDCR